MAMGEMEPRSRSSDRGPRESGYVVGSSPVSVAGSRKCRVAPGKKRRANEQHLAIERKILMSLRIGSAFATLALFLSASSAEPATLARAISRKPWATLSP